MCIEQVCAAVFLDMLTETIIVKPDDAPGQKPARCPPDPLNGKNEGRIIFSVTLLALLILPIHTFAGESEKTGVLSMPWGSSEGEVGFSPRNTICYRCDVQPALPADWLGTLDRQINKVMCPLDPFKDCIPSPACRCTSVWLTSHSCCPRITWGNHVNQTGTKKIQPCPETDRQLCGHDTLHHGRSCVCHSRTVLPQ
ncbi:MAG: hypothetical protein H6Q56_826 [Deltaproteobacteria bacterium]|nr:hypothetical protein [Deltaproteobacteria bacterium]